MTMPFSYPVLLWFHAALLLVWLGANLLLLLLCRHVRRRGASSKAEHRAASGLIGPTAIATRIACALMLPSAMLLLQAGNWWPDMMHWLVPSALAIALAWLALIGIASCIGHATSARRARAIAELLPWLLAGFFLMLGFISLRNGGPIDAFLAVKALLLGGIFAANAAGDMAMRRTRRHSGSAAFLISLLLLAAGWLGVTQIVPWL